MGYYTSELIEEILKSEKAKELLGWFPPVYSDAYVFLWLLQEVGASIKRMEQWAEEFADQVMPQRATWSLPYWEERYGIIPNESLSKEQRRNQIVNKRRTRAPMPPKKIEDIITNITGIETKIEENTGKNHFTVVSSGYIPPGLMKMVRKEINKLKPSHLIYRIISSIFYDTEITKYLASAASVLKTYTVKEVV